MSEHREFLPPSPIAFPKENTEELPLTEGILNLNELQLDTTNLPTPPLVPSVPKILSTTVIPNTLEHKETFPFDESKRLLDEVRESEKLVIDTNFSLKNEEINEETSVEETSVEENAVLKDLTTLTSLVSLLVLQDDRMQKYNVTVSPKAKEILMRLLGINNYFDHVEKLMKEIVHDNKIDARDVPKIMILLTELYKILKDVKDIEFDEQLCGDVLKILFDIALKEQLIVIDEEDMELIISLYEIVDTSISLMQTDTSGKKKGIIYYIKQIFNSCKQ